MRHDNSLARVRTRLAQLMIPLVWLAASALSAADADPPGRVARVNFLEGSGSMQAAGVDGWTDDLLNRPLTGGDRVWIDERSRAEMHVGSTVLRLGSRTAVQILAVDDQTVRLSLTAGSLSVRIRNLDADERFEIETPGGEVSLQQPGDYRLDVDDSNARTYLAVWAGSADVSGPAGAHTVRQQQSAELVAGAEPAIDTTTAGTIDSLDLWAEDRDRREDQSLAAQYVSRDVVGYQDLDGYGQWVSEPAYGMVWVPVVAAGWAPYHYGYWNWIGPWGWTWIANEPWGFAPCHYGRWVHARHGWAWLPGPRGGPRPVYAPALVAWRGERYARTNPDIKHRPKVGWIPLGNNEVYDPPFHASANYLRAANLSNTHLGRVDLDRYVNERQRGAARGADRRYANDNVKGAYADAPREAFTSVQSIGPPRGRVEPNISLRARFAPHEVPHAAPVDRPVAHPVGYAPEASSDRPHPRASTRIDVESPRQPDRPPSQAQGAVGRAVQSPYVAPLPGSRQMHPIVSESQTRQPVVREAEPQHPVVREAQPQQPAVRMTQPQQPVARVAEPRQAVVRESEPRQYSPAPVRSAPPPAAPAAVGHDSHPQVSRQERQP